MDHIKAKSEKYGGETLAQHTWDVLAKLAELRALRPNLAHQIGIPRLWHCLFWACLLHDFGKAARGFQDRLTGGPAWYQRHEVLMVRQIRGLLYEQGYTIGGARLRLEGEGAKQESALSNQIAKQVRMELEEVLQLLRR